MTKRFSLICALLMLVTQTAFAYEDAERFFKKHVDLGSSFDPAIADL